MAMPDLHEVVLDALDLHASYEIPHVHLEPAQRYLVVASGNALPTGRILFADERAFFCNEGQYLTLLEREPEIDSAIVISASGTKHAPSIVKDLLARNLTPHLITCNALSPAAALLPANYIVETKSNPEPITYNTSTYLGMIFARTRENPLEIKRHLLNVVDSLIPDFRAYDAFYLMVPPEFEAVLEMLRTKFDELFGGRVTGRCYTLEQTLHAKTVVPWEKELFVSFGFHNEDFGLARLEIPLSDDASFAAMMATGYYVIGRIQAQFPPWFKEHAEAYAGFQQQMFEKLERSRVTEARLHPSIRWLSRRK